MSEQDIKGESYWIRYDQATTTVKFQGKLALTGAKDYLAINALLQNVVAQAPSDMTLDLRELSFLNSSGISMLSKFVLGLRKQAQLQLIVLGSHQMSWQSKSLKNLQKFLPSLRLEVE
ncbi:MAG: slr1659 superfamily regulator [Spirulinaceae cyanobacterium]